MEMVRILAFDLGAESGRAVVGHFDGEMLQIEELRRFNNRPVRVGKSLHWDVLYLWSEIKSSLNTAANMYGDSLVSIGLDTWGVDFGLLAADDTLLGNPYHYRDRRTDGMMELAFTRVPRDAIYEKTGIQFIRINSLFQLLAMVEAKAPALAIAKTFLTMPDLFNFWLTGRKANEFTIATTTQCYNPRVGNWAHKLLQQMGIPTHIFQEIVQPGTILGSLRSDIVEETSCPLIPVVAPATHDTGSAVAAVPVSSHDYIYISSGTWSLMGVEIEKPLITAQSLAHNFTNEGGVDGSFRLLKNITGLWLVQECRRYWANQGMALSYKDLTRLAGATQPFGSLVFPGDARFLAPGDMPARIQLFCRESGQPVPETKGEIVRCALESLALEYRRIAECLDDLLGKRLPTIHIIGGGSRNALLNQYTANATGRTVVAGPVEATAIGNLLLQARALGHIKSLKAIRAIVQRSFNTKVYYPENEASWDELFHRYLKIAEKQNH